MREKLNPCPVCGEEHPVLRVVIPHKGWNAMSAGFCPRCYMSGPVVVGDEEAARVWNAMPRALRWTSKRPETEGWYWWRESISETPEIVHVFWKKWSESSDAVLCAIFMERIEIQEINEMSGEWGGIIQKPKESNDE